MKHYPFPLWIKAACVVIILMVGFTIHMNLRFFKARILLSQSIQLGFADDQWEQASGNMEKATRLVPEMKELNILWHYMAGVHEMQSGNYVAAADHLEYCGDLPPNYQVGTLLLNARSGAAFDKKDYSEFLNISLQKQQSDPNEPMTLAQVSSAYACVYAADGHEENKHKSLDCLTQAERIYGQSIPEEFTEYKERILYRLQTRQILTKEEYQRKKENKEI